MQTPMRVLSSLTGRIFLASAALTLVCTGIAIWLINLRVTASAEDEVRRGLAQTEALVDRQRAMLSDVLVVQARLVADLPKLKAAVDTGDPPTVRAVAEGYQRQLGSDLFLVTDRSGRVLAAAGEAAMAPGTVPTTIREAAAGRESAAFWTTPQGILQVVSVPITAGTGTSDVLGTLSAGTLLGDGLAARLKALTGSEIAFAAGGRILASTLRGADRGRTLASALPARGITRVSVDGTDYLAAARPLTPPALGARGPAEPREEAGLHPPGGDRPRPAVFILQSRTDRLRFLRPIQAALGVTAVIAVLLATGLSYATARTITRPLAAITATMKEMAATGDLATRIGWRARRWEDEDARLLARTFNTLTESIARFQREAAERERLSALGRLSTIIAHEIRNPLMIIKATLRPLDRDAVSPEDVRAAVADITDEVMRLNRLVNEVLDFARPIRFECAEVDVNRICEESAAAAMAGLVCAPVRLVLDPSTPRIVTDGERLRAVLVNLLANARQAVEARAGSGGAPAGEGDVGLQVTSLPGGRCAITVQDRGVGVPPEQLARVFEPFFTTRRTGTGLGLAIARNIIQGLGGSIAMSSQAGIGTTVRVELPAAAPSSVENEE